MAHLDLVALIVEDYDPAIDFFVRVLRFELIEDVPSTTNDGRPKRWVVVRPAGGTTGILLARADGEHQQSAVGHQFAGRVGLFLHVEDFDAAYARMVDAGVAMEPTRDGPWTRAADASRCPMLPLLSSFTRSNGENPSRARPVHRPFHLLDRKGADAHAAIRVPDNERRALTGLAGPRSF